MKIENQVCTYEQGKKLKELGITARSTFTHCFHYVGSSTITNTDSGLHHEVPKSAPAFTVAELGVMLPKGMTLCENTNSKKEAARWICGSVGGIDYEGDYDYVDCAYGPTEAQARAALLIDLLVVGSITKEEVDDRLNNA